MLILESRASDVYAAPVAPDENAGKSFLERMASAPAEIGAAFSAAKQQTEFTQGALTMRDMRAKIYDELAAQVKEAAGVTLENPTAFGLSQSPQIAELARQRAASGLPAEGLIPDFMAQREADFMQQLRDLKQQQHDKLLAVDVDTPISERIAQRFQANHGAAAAAENLHWSLRLPAELAGSLVGSTSDPMFWASFTLPMGGVGKTVASRIGSAAVAQGAGMAALEAIKQPVEQELRAQAGLPNNALENIAMGAAGGALLGGAVHGVVEAAVIRPALRRIREGAATPADYETAARHGVHIDEPTQQAIAQEAEAVRAHAEVLKAPDTVPEAAADRAFAEGLAHVEDPNAPPPLVDRPVPPGTTDDLAREVVGKAENAGEAIDALRADPKAVESALASHDPELRDLGRLATLGDEALTLVKNDEVDPLHGAVVAGSSHDPAMQSELMSAIKDAKPQTIEEARRVVTEHLASKSAPEAAASRAGSMAAPETPAVPLPERVSEPSAMVNQVPFVRPDGTIAFLRREEIGRAAERERWMGDVIAACKD